MFFSGRSQPIVVAAVLFALLALGMVHAETAVASGRHSEVAAAAHNACRALHGAAQHPGIQLRTTASRGRLAFGNFYTLGRPAFLRRPPASRLALLAGQRRTSTLCADTPAPPRAPPATFL